MDGVPSPDSDQSITDDSTNLSLIVPEAASALPGTGHWGTANHVPYSTVLKPPHSPDADVSSNSSTEDSGDTIDHANKGASWGDNSLMVDPPQGESHIPMSSLLGPPSHARRELPEPLTEEIMERIFAEVPMGAQLAIRICVDCWQRNKIPPGDLISFLKSMRGHSTLLADLFVSEGADGPPPQPHPLHAHAAPHHGGPDAFDGQSSAASGQPTPNMGYRPCFPNVRADSWLDAQAFSSAYGTSGPGPPPESGEGGVGGKRQREGSGRSTDETDSLTFSNGNEPHGHYPMPYRPGAMGHDGGDGGGRPAPHGTRRHQHPSQLQRLPSARMQDLLQAVRDWLPCLEARKRFLALITRYRNSLDSPEMLANEVNRLLDDYQSSPLDDAAANGGGGGGAQQYASHHHHRPDPHGVSRGAHSHGLGMQFEAARGPARPAEGPSRFARDRETPEDSMPASHVEQENLDSAAPAGGCALCRDKPVHDPRWVACDGCDQRVHHVCAMYNELQARDRHFFCQAEHCQRMAMLAGASLQGTSSVCSAEALVESPLANYLTFRARKAGASAGQPVVVRVLSDSERVAASGEPLRAKSIFVFQGVEGSSQAEVIVLALFAHELSNSRLIYLQTVDSNPLYSTNNTTEEGERRQHLVTAVVMGYIEYSKDLGYDRVLMRVPAPTDHQSHVFTERSFTVRLRVTVHLSHWYTHVTQRCLRSGLAVAFVAGRTTDNVEFPTALLEPYDLECEDAFTQMIEQHGGTEPNIQPAAKADRFFVLRLRERSEMNRIVSDPSPLLPESLTSSRNEFVRLCQHERYRFHYLPYAQFATMMLVYRLLILQHQRASALCAGGQASVNRMEGRGEGPEENGMRAQGGEGLRRGGLGGVQEEQSSAGYHERQGRRGMTPSMDSRGGMMDQGGAQAGMMDQGGERGGRWEGSVEQQREYDMMQRTVDQRHFAALMSGYHPHMGQIQGPGRGMDMGLKSPEAMSGFGFVHSRYPTDHELQYGHMQAAHAMAQPWGLGPWEMRKQGPPRGYGGDGNGNGNGNGMEGSPGFGGTGNWGEVGWPRGQGPGMWSAGMPNEWLAARGGAPPQYWR